MFSLRAPTHPVNPAKTIISKPFHSIHNSKKKMNLPIMKVIAPAHMKMKAGSRAMLVSLLRLLKVSFSDQAQIPMAKIPNPRS